jgi:hypothetical protein
MKVREGSQAVLAFPLTDADGNGARLANKRVELVIADKDSDKRETLVLNNQQESSWGKVTVSGENSTQILTVTGSSGSFKLRYNNETTDTLAYNATAAQVQAALAAIAQLGHECALLRRAAPHKSRHGGVYRESPQCPTSTFASRRRDRRYGEHHRPDDSVP